VLIVSVLVRRLPPHFVYLGFRLQLTNSALVSASCFALKAPVFSTERAVLISIFGLAAVQLCLLFVLLVSS
jgi:hypothetical protein